MALALVNQDVAGAVHRLEPEALALHLDRAEHAVRKVFKMPRGFVELLVHDVRRDHGLVPAFGQTLADEVLDDSPDKRSFRMPEHEAAAGILFDRIEIEFGAEFAVVAFRRFFEKDEVVVEFLLRRKGGPVDALQHRVVLVAPPVRARDAHQLDRADLARRFGVTAAAEIGKVADRVERDRLALGNVARQFDFERVVAVAFERFTAFDAPAGHLVVLFDDLVHALLELGQIVGRERLRAREIVVEPVLDRGSDRGFRLRKEILHRIGKNVRRSMAEFIEGHYVCLGAARPGSLG